MTAISNRFAIALLACVLAVGVGVPPFCAGGANAQDCASGCKAAYGECYKSTQNRAACDAQLQGCLVRCR